MPIQAFRQRISFARPSDNCMTGSLARYVVVASGQFHLLTKGLPHPKASLPIIIFSKSQLHLCLALQGAERRNIFSHIITLSL